MNWEQVGKKFRAQGGGCRQRETVGSCPEGVPWVQLVPLYQYGWGSGVTHEQSTKRLQAASGVH